LMKNPRLMRKKDNELYLKPGKPSESRNKSDWYRSKKRKNTTRFKPMATVEIDEYILYD